MVDFYQIRSALSRISDERMGQFIRQLEEKLGQELRRVPLAQYLADDFALLYVASGGSEGYFRSGPTTTATSSAGATTPGRWRPSSGF